MSETPAAFELPEADALAALSDADLASLADAARAEAHGLSTAEIFTSADADRLEYLATAVETIGAQVAANAAAQAELNSRRDALAARLAPVEPVVAEPVVTEPALAAEPVVEPVIETPAAPVVAAPAARAVIARAPQAVVPVTPAPSAPKAIIAAAADVDGMTAGARVEQLTDLVPAIQRRWESYPLNMPAGTPRIKHSLATIQIPFSADLRVDQQGAEATFEIMKRAADQSRLPGGGLIAAGGWCAPSETVYDVCSAGDVTGLFSLPEIGAPRGGIRYTRALDYQTIFAQIQALTMCATETELVATPPLEKDCVEVDCPTFTEVRMDACWLCVKTALLQNRAYPEYVREFLRTAVVAHQNLMDTRTVNAVVTLLGAATVIPATFAAIAPLMTAIDLAAIDFRYKHSMPIDATLEVVLPEWIVGALRADFIRRNAADADDLAKAQVTAWFAARNVSVQFIRNWQATGFGQVAKATAWPTTVQFMLYEAGSYVRLREDIIRVDTLSDSTLLTTNRQLGLFVEEGWAIAPMCKDGRLYTVNICPNGQTGGQQAAVGSSACPLA